MINLLLLIISLGWSQSKELTGRDIMMLVDEREDGNDRRVEMEMILINKRGRKRIRQVLSYSKDYGKDSKTIMIFQKPADVKGTGFLSWEYDDDSKNDDRWLYMPALKKVRRISGASNNDYFMGSDFTYDDMGGRNPDEDTHTLLREEDLNEELCWVVESIPKEKDNIYVKKIVWVRQDVKMSVKVEYYDKLGLMKTLTIKNIRQVDGIWTAHEMCMDNEAEKHQTILKFNQISYNQDLKDNIFTVSAIEKGIMK